MEAMILLMVVNEDRFFLSHRKEIAVAAKQTGWNVTVVCKDTGQRHDVEALGLKMIELPINPTGTNILQELKTCWFLYRLYRHNQDAVVHHVGLKNILWGGLAAKMAGVKGVVNAVSGLGVMFSGDSLSSMAKGIMAVMRFSNHRQGVKVIFQNQEDKTLFLEHGVVQDSQTTFIKGSGVDLKVFQYVPEPSSDTLKVVFAARMVKEKGILELIDAAEKLRQDFEGKVEFWLCGRLAANEDAISKAELEALCDGKYIKWLGFCANMRSILEQCHVVAFPSYYREGVPKSLIDACAVGRPIVTTRSIGCKDVVDDGVNGFLVPIKDSETLAQKLRILFEDKDRRIQMGKASRARAEKEFSLETVVNKHLEIYQSLI